jgi:hypothetical protein
MAEPKSLESVNAEAALFSGQLDGLIASFHENERPLAGLAGLLDWRFRGAISRALASGAISGREGECVYLPVSRAGRTFHLILAGAGKSAGPGRRADLPEATWKALARNVAGLRLARLGISRTDLGELDEAALARRMKGQTVWIVK